MNKRLVTLFAAVSALAGATVASAADLPARSRSYAAPITPVAAFSWTGFYIGANVGYGFGNTTGNAANPLPGNFDIDGGLAGVQGGYNWQFNNWVVGIEADYQWADIDGSKTVGAFTDSAKLSRFGTVRGRIGYAWDRWLVYGTGGYAFEGNMRYSFVTPVAGTSRQSLDGYAVGGGVEYAFAPNWSAKVEYLHVALDDKAAPPLACAGAFCRAGADIDTVRFGVNYKFGGMGWR